MSIKRLSGKTLAECSNIVKKPFSDMNLEGVIGVGMNKKIRLLSIGVGISCLSGCASLEIMVVGGISYLLTGKGLSDHALSMTLGEDCAFHRIVTEGSLCTEEQQLPVDTLLSEQESESSVLALTETQNSDIAASEDKVIAGSVVANVDASVDVDSLVNLDLPLQQNTPPQVYAVVGSFNDLKYAFERSTLYRIYNTQIIETPAGSETRYRVVVGPLSDRGLISHIPNKVDGSNQAHWAIELCEDSLMPPPCGGGLLAKN